MGTASYKLLKVVGGRLRYADVTASSEFGGGCSISVSPTAFAWLKSAYGPDAEWPECDAHRAAAVAGAEFALRHVADRDGIPEARVVIDRIHTAPADTVPDDVAYAAVFAVWQALGVEGSQLPALTGKRTKPGASPDPFRPFAFSPAWRSPTVLALASQMYESRDFGAMPILADALQDAGCDRAYVLDHCRSPGPHVGGCWVVDLVLGKE
ncbi:hypothetical protein VT84_14430 [Gemmata sp. SH-PL17]|uniref:hypothetical protein n=1 Tax=Gemmata sp. SH-PL17 TaxID=1630693 RepID=UPI00078B2257|nr:hypothetical protein [Gemmata sp. SH-PL17]AMV25590.1 hypothetical protein VT84_14430 [Gemmata sp. SH-PL17]